MKTTRGKDDEAVRAYIIKESKRHEKTTTREILSTKLDQKLNIIMHGEVS